jgi:hypothetical protein
MTHEQTQPIFSSELIIEKVRLQMLKLGLPMNLLDLSRYQKANLSYNVGAIRSTEPLVIADVQREMHVVDFPINPQIIDQASESLTPAQIEILNQFTSQRNGRIELTSGDFVLEFSVTITDGIPLNCSMKRDNQENILITNELTEPGQIHFNTELQVALSTLYDNAVTVIGKMKNEGVTPTHSI